MSEAPNEELTKSWVLVNSIEDKAPTSGVEEVSNAESDSDSISVISESACSYKTDDDEIITPEDQEAADEDDQDNDNKTIQIIKIIRNALPPSEEVVDKTDQNNDVRSLQIVETLRIDSLNQQFYFMTSVICAIILVGLSVAIQHYYKGTVEIDNYNDHTVYRSSMDHHVGVPYRESQLPNKKDKRKNRAKEFAKKKKNYKTAMDYKEEHTSTVNPKEHDDIINDNVNSENNHHKITENYEQQLEELHFREDFLRQKERFLLQKEQFLLKQEFKLLEKKGQRHDKKNKDRKNAKTNAEPQKRSTQNKNNKGEKRYFVDNLQKTLDNNKHNMTGQWYIDLSKGRNHIRQKEHRSDWYFDRAYLRSSKRNKAHWYFQLMADRQRLRTKSKI